MPVPPAFAIALAEAPAANTVFGRFPTGCQREYLEWIATARRPETQERRIREAIVAIASARDRNGKYRG